MNLEYGNWDSPQSYSSNDGGNFSTDYGAQSPMISYGPGAGGKKQQLGKPKSNARSSFGGGGGGGGGGSDIYDFEISQDMDEDYSPVHRQSKRGGGRVRNSSDNSRAKRYSYDEDPPAIKPSRRSSETFTSAVTTSAVNRRNSISDTKSGMYERKSTESRIQEILEKNKIEAPIVSKFDNEPKEGDDMLNSYQKLWADVMEGVGGVSSPEISKSFDISSTLPKSQSIPQASQVSRNQPLKPRTSMDSLSDSFDISPADFEVGVTAARRKQEKTNERMKRVALEYPPHNKSQDSIGQANIPYRGVDASPNVHGKSNNRENRKGSAFSTALSSIYKQGGDNDNAVRESGGGMVRYGSVSADSDFYKMAKTLTDKEGNLNSMNLSGGMSSVSNSGQEDSDRLHRHNNNGRQSPSQFSDVSGSDKNDSDDGGGFNENMRGNKEIGLKDDDDDDDGDDDSGQSTQAQSRGNLKGSDDDYSLDEFEDNVPVIKKETEKPKAIAPQVVLAEVQRIEDIKNRWLMPIPSPDKVPTSIANAKIEEIPISTKIDEKDKVIIVDNNEKKESDFELNNEEEYNENTFDNSENAIRISPETIVEHKVVVVETKIVKVEEKKDIVVTKIEDDIYIEEDNFDEPLYPDDSDVNNDDIDNTESKAIEQYNDTSSIFTSIPPPAPPTLTVSQELPTGVFISSSSTQNFMPSSHGLRSIVTIPKHLSSNVSMKEDFSAARRLDVDQTDYVSNMNGNQINKSLKSSHGLSRYEDRNHNISRYDDDDIVVINDNSFVNMNSKTNSDNDINVSDIIIHNNINNNNNNNNNNNETRRSNNEVRRSNNVEFQQNNHHNNDNRRNSNDTYYQQNMNRNSNNNNTQSILGYGSNEYDTRNSYQNYNNYNNNNALYGITASEYNTRNSNNNNNNNSRLHHQSNTNNSHISSWSRELPMSSPSTDELHAHLSMIQSYHKRLALAKFNKKLSLKSDVMSTNERKKQATITNTPNTTGRITSKGVVRDAQAIKRLEDGAAKLAQKFEELEQGMKNIKQVDSNVLRNKMKGMSNGPPQAKSSLKGNESRSLVTKSVDVDRNANTRPKTAPVKSTSIPRAIKKTKAPVSNKTTNKQHQVQDDENSDVEAWKEEDWDNNALDTMKKIAQDNANIKMKENEIKQREEALLIRESLIGIGNKTAPINNNDNNNNHFEKEYNKLLRDNNNLIHHHDQEIQSIHDKYQQDMKDIVSKKKDLLKEIDQLKATIFELRQEKLQKEAQEENIPSYPGEREKQIERDIIRSKVHSAYNKEKKEPDTKVIDNITTVTIPKTEYDALISEIDSQEMLITGFQKENERLVNYKRELDHADCTKKAQFFDQQESMNKELNRLRNVIGNDGTIESKSNRIHTNFTATSIGKSADILRAELNNDAQIRSLRERLAIAESGAGLREKELQLTIIKLRDENRNLLTQSNYMRNSVSNHHETNSIQHEVELKKCENQIQELKTKLAWYAENQELIDDADKGKSLLHSTINLLKSELKKRGMDEKFITNLIEGNHSDFIQQHKLNNIDGIELNDTTTTIGRSTNKRNTADIKKIKDLERTIIDLQESLRKRNPDSVTNLILAAKESDEEKLDKKNREIEIFTMKEELNNCKETYERKLRSLRQEHEKIKIQYQSRITDLENNSSNKTDSIPSSKISAKTIIKNLPQAQAKIKNLEEDIEKIRVFYTRKIDEINKKHENQLRAFKRGDKKVYDDDDDDDDYNDELYELKNNYEQKLKKLENELLVTSEELGKSKAENSLLLFKINSKEEIIKLNSIVTTTTYNNNNDVTNNNNNNKENNLENNNNNNNNNNLANKIPINKETENILLSTINDLKLDINTLKEQLNNKLSIINDLQNKIENNINEKELLYKKLREEESKSSFLSSEIINLKNISSIPPTPQLSQFMNMENQINQLEARLLRREKELLNNIEDGKASSKMERSRMKALHDQEIREKDEQLVRFQSELEQLVYTLRQWQYSANNIPSSNDVNQYDLNDAIFQEY